MPALPGPLPVSLVPPLVEPRVQQRIPNTDYGSVCNFEAPCPCGEGRVWWRTERAETAASKPQYQISCTTEPKGNP